MEVKKQDKTIRELYDAFIQNILDNPNKKFDIYLNNPTEEKTKEFKKIMADEKIKIKKMTEILKSHANYKSYNKLILQRIKKMMGDKVVLKTYIYLIQYHVLGMYRENHKEIVEKTGPVKIIKSHLFYRGLTYADVERAILRFIDEAGMCNLDVCEMYIDMLRQSPRPWIDSIAPEVIVGDLTDILDEIIVMKYKILLEQGKTISL